MREISRKGSRAIGIHTNIRTINARNWIGKEHTVAGELEFQRKIWKLKNRRTEKGSCKWKGDLEIIQELSISAGISLLMWEKDQYLNQFASTVKWYMKENEMTGRPSHSLRIAFSANRT